MAGLSIGCSNGAPTSHTRLPPSTHLPHRPAPAPSSSRGWQVRARPQEPGGPSPLLAAAAAAVAPSPCWLASLASRSGKPRTQATRLLLFGRCCRPPCGACVCQGGRGFARRGVSQSEALKEVEYELRRWAVVRASSPIWRGGRGGGALRPHAWGGAVLLACLAWEAPSVHSRSSHALGRPHLMPTINSGPSMVAAG